MYVRTRVNARAYAGDATAASAEATLLLSIVVVVVAVRVRVCVGQLCPGPSKRNADEAQGISDHRHGELREGELNTKLRYSFYIRVEPVV